MYSRQSLPSSSNRGYFHHFMVVVGRLDRDQEEQTRFCKKGYNVSSSNHGDTRPESDKIMVLDYCCSTVEHLEHVQYFYLDESFPHARNVVRFQRRGGGNRNPFRRRIPCQTKQMAKCASWSSPAHVVGTYGGFHPYRFRRLRRSNTRQYRRGWYNTQERSWLHATYGAEPLKEANNKLL